MTSSTYHQGLCAACWLSLVAQHEVQASNRCVIPPSRVALAQLCCSCAWIIPVKHPQHLQRIQPMAGCFHWHFTSMPDIRLGPHWISGWHLGLTDGSALTCRPCPPALHRYIFSEASLYMLLLTNVISLFHIVFDYLAFKNDVGFYRNRNDYTGISGRSILSSFVRVCFPHPLCFT